MESFTIFRNTLEALQSYPPETAKNALMYIGWYALDGVEPAGDDVFAYALFCQVRPVIDKRNKKAEAGRIGGEANRKQTEANAKQNEANSENAEENIKSKSKKEKVKSKNIKSIGRFRPPSLTEVQEYVDQGGYECDAQRFIDYYSSNGWMVGKNHMKDWKAAVRNWSRNQRQGITANGRQGETAKTHNFTPRSYDYDELERSLLQKQGDNYDN